MPNEVLDRRLEFLTLPAEIRLKIYRHVLNDLLPDLQLCVQCFGYCGSGQPSVNVLWTSRSVRKEAAPIFNEVLRATTLDLRQYCQSGHPQDATLKGRTLLDCYGCFVTKLRLDPAMVPWISGFLPLLTGLKTVIMDFELSKNELRSQDRSDIQVFWLRGHNDEMFVQIGRLAAQNFITAPLERKRQSNGGEYKLPHFEVLVVAIFNFEDAHELNELVWPSFLPTLDRDDRSTDCHYRCCSE